VAAAASAAPAGAVPARVPAGPADADAARVQAQAPVDAVPALVRVLAPVRDPGQVPADEALA